jgi:hypothetical protein
MTSASLAVLSSKRWMLFHQRQKAHHLVARFPGSPLARDFETMRMFSAQPNVVSAVCFSIRMLPECYSASLLI